MARILVLDDEEQLREMLQAMLERVGYDVRAAGDSEEGMRLFRQDPADLIIVDLFMPSRGGLEVIREVRKVSPDAKIIAITGVQVREHLDLLSLARKLGALRTFEKPFSRKDMLDAVKQLLEGV